MIRLHPFLAVILVVAASPSVASAGASSIIAAQLEAEGDRMSVDRANLSEAIGLYDRAIALEDPTPRRLYRRSQLRLVAGDPRGAIADLSWALARPGADREAVFALRCRAKRLVGDRRGALADCGEAERLNPDDPIANGERAELELLAGNLGPAWRYATTASEMDSRTTRYETIRCRIAQRMNAQEKITEACARAQQIGADDR